MRDKKKKLNCRKSVKSSQSDVDNGLKLSSLLMLKKDSTRRKSKSDAKRPGAKLSSKAVADSLDKETRNVTVNKKLIGRKVLHKTLDKKSCKKLSPLSYEGKKSSLRRDEGANENDVGDKTRKLKKRKKKRTQNGNVELDDASRLQRRTRYLLIKIKLEQNLIDAYSGEGWKGQSREKIRPEKEIQRAMKQILKCKLGIRDAIHQMDSLSSVGSIENSVIAPDGSVYHEHIFCAKCKLNEAFPDNDIILCDGTCNCAYHQKCLDPPLDTENIPPGDQGWFCKFCECKMEIIEQINAHLGTRFSMDSNWQDIFKEEAVFPDGGAALLNPEEEWPSDDSEDYDYNPERREDSCRFSMEGTGDNTSDDISSSASFWSLNDEYSSAEHGIGSCVDSDESAEADIIFGRRQRRAVDYRKLYDEMFGKDAPAYEQVSEDEDWGPTKRKRREKESDAASTLMTLYESEKNCPNDDDRDVDRKLTSGMQIRRSTFRIPHDAVEKLRQVFAENELPSRSFKESLSEELGLDPEKVSKWFKNARYLALKTRKEATPKQLCSFTPIINNDSRSENVEKADALTSQENSIENVANAQKNVEKVFHRKHLKSSGSSLKKKQQRISSLQSDENNKDCMELGDDVSLKKLLKARTKGKKRVNCMPGGDFQVAEAELDRLSKVRGRLHTLKQKLVEFQSNRTNRSDETHLNDQKVIYVPVAVLREKV
ncbi:Pathogenesis-related homeodomain protein [Quillaja saponaria]|uniref:Pathogenesis-related homeodomain protein n=1 Tax=Quillaja saponaria TaxID=32244 RepID=A0AAD7QDC8_QUISA|nr:Pathogenesis-related homeodomain protein [Quillaja saponaria]